jgi:hypothetical protein
MPLRLRSYDLGEIGILIDIDEIRNAQIETYGLLKADESHTFYHDETNNIKKLRLSDINSSSPETIPASSVTPASPEMPDVEARACSLM